MYPTTGKLRFAPECRIQGSEELHLKSNQYDKLADSYLQETEQSACNAMCERPATLSLIGDISGKAVLDAACGTGYYAGYCERSGADPIVAFDGSPNMIELARRQLTRTRLIVHDLGEPLPGTHDNTFDMVICGLAMEYVENLNTCLKEFTRILKPAGVLIFSIENPALVFNRYGSRYWEQELVEHTSSYLDGIFGYRRPLSMYLNGLTETGFIFDRIVEAQPNEQCRTTYPEKYERMMKVPYFFSIRARTIS